MRGCWLPKSKAALATGLTPHEFTKTYGVKLKQRHERKWPEYFLPEDKMLDASKAALADCMEDYDSDAEDIVESVLGDLTDGSLDGATGIPLNLDDQLRAAQIANTEARTRMLSEKLERRKTELFNEWSEAFFTAFTEAFSKFKNELIALALSEEQLSILQEKLSLALQSLQDKLSYLEQDYIEKEEKAEE